MGTWQGIGLTADGVRGGTNQTAAARITLRFGKWDNMASIILFSSVLHIPLWIQICFCSNWVMCQACDYWRNGYIYNGRKFVLRFEEMTYNDMSLKTSLVLTDDALTPLLDWHTSGLQVPPYWKCYIGGDLCPWELFWRPKYSEVTGSKASGNEWGNVPSEVINSCQLAQSDSHMTHIFWVSVLLFCVLCTGSE